MEYEESFIAWGHPNIRSSHETTLMLTREEHLTKRGDCILAIKAEKGLRDLKPNLKELLRKDGSKVIVTLETGDTKFEVIGWGSSKLTLSHPDEMVIRKSSYVSDRTLMIGANKAASDVPPEFIKLLQDESREIKVNIKVIL
jgi:hypothetical protein